MDSTNSIGKPGEQTSEFKATKWAMLASTLLPIAALILEFDACGAWVFPRPNQNESS